MKTLLRLLLRLFPENVEGFSRSEMEETFMDGYRQAPAPLRYAATELLALFLAGTTERLRLLLHREGRPHDRGSFAVRDDLRLALRKLRKDPGFAVSAVVILAVGIGATVAMFSILEAAFLRALPYPEPGELVLGRATFSGSMNMTCSFPDYLDQKEGTDAFDGMAAVLSPQRYTLTGGESPVRVTAHWVTADLFDVLGVSAAVGRTFTLDDVAPSAQDVVVISYGLWQRWFGGDAAALGQSLDISGSTATVVGVMPPGFRFMYDTDIWAPVRMGMFDTEGRRSHSWQVVGRLKDGVTLTQAQAQADVVSAQLAKAYPESHTNKGMGFVPLGAGLGEDYRPALLLLMGATSLLLLIACGNVAGLLTARATTRRVELSVRSALGATRGALVCQLLWESLVVAVLAGALGTVLALVIQRSVLATVPLDLLGVREVGLSHPMLAFAMMISVGTALVFGTGPALSASRVQPADDLRGSRAGTDGQAVGRARGGLVVAQVALSVILLTGSGLLIRSFVQLRAVDLGFPTEDLLTAGVSVGIGTYPDPESRTRFFQALASDIEALPGVEAVSFTNKIPILHRWMNWYIWDADAPPEDPEGRLSTYSRFVLPGYFKTLGVPVLRGRDHAPTDEARGEPYLVINQSAAEALFPDQDPIGRRIAVFNGMQEDSYEVLGVVADFRITSVDRTPSPQMYFNHTTYPSTTMHAVVRAHTDIGNLTSSIRQALSARDPNVPLESVARMDEIVASSISETRILGVATALFAGTALLLALTGLYAVLAFYVGRRTREIGIRVALGASRIHVSRMVIGRGLALVGLGLVLGLLSAGGLATLLRSQLYQVESLDPLTFTTVAVGFLVVGVSAALLPVRRATRVDPVRAMHPE